MLPYLIKLQFVGTIMIKQVFHDLFSYLMVNFWQSKKNFYPSMSAVAAAGFQTSKLISKKCSKLGKTAIFSWGMLL